MALLSVRHLTTTIDTASGPVAAVTDVSFEIAPGETLGLVGESGCGKSLTALSILRVLPTSCRIAAGEVWFDGQDLGQRSEAEMRRIRGARIGFVFQEPMAALNPVWTVGRHLEEALQVHGRAAGSSGPRRAEALLAAVRLPEPALRVREYPHQLSGGMRQRVMIAIALACQPALLIADEPTTAVDTTLQAGLLDLLMEMQDSFGLALLLITHDLALLAGIADRVAVMYAGRLVEEGPGATLLTAPSHPYTQGLLASAPPFDDTGHRQPLPTIPGAPPALGRPSPGCAFAPRCLARVARCDDERPARHVPVPGVSVSCHLHAPNRADAR